MPGPLITLPLCALVAWLGVWALVITVRQWTGRRLRRPISDWMQIRVWPSYKRLDTEARLAYDRGGLALGFEMLFFAVFIEAIGIAGAIPARDPGYRQALVDIAAIAFLGFMVSIGLFLIIKYFNRPKILVPPLLRAEPGVIAVRRQRRENLRKQL